jgi:hypothetical protein
MFLTAESYPENAQSALSATINREFMHCRFFGYCSVSKLKSQVTSMRTKTKRKSQLSIVHNRMKFDKERNINK